MTNENQRPELVYPPTEKQQRIFDALLSLIQDNGIHNTPMSKLSQLSGVSTGAIYHDFASKDALVNALYFFVKCQAVDAMLVGYDEHASTKTSFERIWRNYFDHLANHIAHFSFMEQSKNSPIILSETMTEADAYAMPVLSVLVKGIETKVLKNIDVVLMAFLIYGSITASLHLQIMHGELSKEQLDQAVEVIWQGLSV